MLLALVSLVALVPLATLAACSSGGDDGLVLDGPADAGTPADGGASAVPPTAPDEGPRPTLDDPDDLDIGDLDLGDLGSTRMGEGTATVTVGPVTYTGEAQICVADPTSFTFSGPATGSDGSQAWVDVDRTLLTRAEAEEYFDEATVEFLLGDADVLDDTAVSVTLGRTEMLGSGPDDQPLWEAFAGSLGDDMEVEVDGSALRGVGSIRDLHGVGAPFGDAVPLEFEAVCE